MAKAQLPPTTNPVSAVASACASASPAPVTLEATFAVGNEQDAHKALGELYRCHATHLRNLAAWFAGGERDFIDDAVNEALAEAWRRRRTYNPTLGWVKWVGVWLRFRVRDHYRQRGGLPPQEPEEGVLATQTVGTAQLPDRRAAERDFYAHLLDRLCVANSDAHGAFVLYAEGYSKSEIAEKLSISLPATRRLLEQARELLEYFARQSGGTT